MKDLKFSALLDLYGKMLTDKQYRMTEQYYHLDYSLAEIAENEGVSRQAVHASLRGAQAALAELENKLGFYEKTRKIQSIVGNAASAADTEKLKEAMIKIGELI